MKVDYPDWLNLEDYEVRVNKMKQDLNNKNIDKNFHKLMSTYQL